MALSDSVPDSVQTDLPASGMNRTSILECGLCVAAFLLVSVALAYVLAWI